MSANGNALDVWVVETNTVYRDVPYTVVADWLQQGRLLENDMVRAAGTKDWQKAAAVPDLAAYLARPDPHRAEDQAEALERVEVGVGTARDEEDEDVDMIPLIDVSLVLLIFFMMTATLGGATGLFNPPAAEHGYQLAVTDLWVGVSRQADGSARYSLGRREQGPEPGAERLPLNELLPRLDELLDPVHPVEVLIRADQNLRLGQVRDLVEGLEGRKSRGVSKIYNEVTEKQRP